MREKFYTEISTKWGLSKPVFNTLVCVVLSGVAALLYFLFIEDSPDPETVRSNIVWAFGFAMVITLGAAYSFGGFDKRYAFQDLAPQGHEIKINRLRSFWVGVRVFFALIAILVMCVVVYASAYSLVTEEASVLDRLWSLAVLLFVILLTFAIVFCFFYMVQTWRAAARAPFYVSFSKEGLSVPAFSSNPIPWSDVVGIDVLTFRGLKRLDLFANSFQFKIKNSSKHLEPRSTIQKWLVTRQRKKMGTDDVWIGVIDLGEGGTKLLIQAVRSYAPHALPQERNDFMGFLFR